MSNNPSQGLNLGGQPQAYGDAFSALNLFYGADAWITRGPNGEEIRGQVSVDEKGWLTEMPLVNGQPQPVIANVFYTKIIPAGSYIVEWKGEGTLTTYSNFESLGNNKFRINFDGSSPTNESGISLIIENTDPNNTGNYIRDIKIYKEEYSDLVAMGEKFDPKWFDAIDDYRVLRTHDWQGTNFSTVTNWTRNDETADQAFWIREGRGMPYELLVEVANESRSDLWINIPHMATDEYMRKAAQYVKDNLDAGLRVYVEYTNEFWTTIFDQHPYLNDKGRELFGNAQFANSQAYGARASQMTQIFKEVFGADAERLFPTITVSSEMFNTGEALAVLNTPDYVAQGGISPLDAGIRHLATDAYVGWFNTDPYWDNLINTWRTQADGGFGSARNELIRQLIEEKVPDWEVGRALADREGLSFGIYEGGALLINGLDNTGGNPVYTNFNEAVQLSPQMREVYEAMLAAWQKVGGGPFAWYSDVGRWGPWGDYGLWNAPNFEPELRTEAIIDANQNTEPWWAGDTRGGSNFDNGRYAAGTASADTMRGTALGDRLYGLTGNDILITGDGADTLVGGLGFDNLYGGRGADKHFGGDGASADYARYDDANYGNLMLRLDAPNLNTGAAAVGDTYTGIEGLVGGSGSDVIVGNAANNYVFGVGGNDYMDGRQGNDYLNGGAGADRFRFATALNATTNVDTIVGFTPGTDDLLLKQSIFASIGTSLSVSEFRIGPAALDVNDHIIYNNVTGELFYDPNGNGAGGQILFARLTSGLALTVADFVMV
ncbi:MAG: calcium-binding protein [Rhizobiaceae bacterium]